MHLNSRWKWALMADVGFHEEMYPVSRILRSFYWKSGPKKGLMKNSLNQAISISMTHIYLFSELYLMSYSPVVTVISDWMEWNESSRQSSSIWPSVGVFQGSSAFNDCRDTETAVDFRGGIFHKVSIRVHSL